jgi:hypothetical protein
MMSERSDSADQHFRTLVKAYEDVGNRTWLTGDFIESNLEVSRNLFAPESLASRRPRPKGLEVLALVSGLPFRADFFNDLVQMQQQFAAVLADSLHYWVAPANLGLEYCVFKWPNESITQEQGNFIRKVLGELRYPSFTFSIRGVQINPDGCVVAKGFDDGGILFEIRQRLRAEIPFLPDRQSGWAHVPLGRILEPLGKEKFVKLRHLAEAMKETPVFSTELDVLRLVHETRWYMEERTILAEYPSGDGVGRAGR